MEFSEDRQLDPVTPEPQEAPVSEQNEADTTWHGEGVGQQEFFTASPGEAWAEPEPIPEPEPEPKPEPEFEPVFERTYTPQPEQYTVPQKRRCKPGLGRKLLAAVLAAAGSDATRVIKTTCFIADMADFAAFNEVYAKYFTGKPARSCCAVRQLPKNVLCEIEAIAEL